MGRDPTVGQEWVEVLPEQLKDTRRPPVVSRGGIEELWYAHGASLLDDKSYCVGCSWRENHVKGFPATFHLVFCCCRDHSSRCHIESGLHDVCIDTGSGSLGLQSLLSLGPLLAVIANIGPLSRNWLARVCLSCWLR